MIQKNLEIIIITYNRSKDLIRTLKKLLESPFSACKFTIIDNCSTDETPKICAEYKKLFPKLKIVRNKNNIGGNANIMKAVETSKSKYTWILCDDDYYDFSECDDVINAINSEKYDLISVGHPNYSNWERGIETSCKKLINGNATYFTTQSFIPTTIYKTELYDSLCIQKSYLNIHNMFPHFAFISKSIEEDFLIYVSRKTIVCRGEHNFPGFSGLEWLAGWINSCYLIKDKEIRTKAIYEITMGSSLLKTLFYFIIAEKMIGNKDFNKNFISFSSGYILAFGFSKEIVLLPLLILSILVPPVIYRNIRRKYVITRYGKEEYDKRNSKLNINSDNLRRI